jgi:hypothetical protein
VEKLAIVSTFMTDFIGMLPPSIADFLSYRFRLLKWWSLQNVLAQTSRAAR